MKIKAKAKINLSLNIVGVENGFHNLQSVVSEISLCDILYIKKSKEICVKYSNFNVEPERDNTVKAIKEFILEFKVEPVSVFVKKAIPAKAGLGGSSADAVGVVKAMQKLYNITDTDRVVKVLEKIGSDCPVQYYGGYNLMEGRGQKITKIDSKKTLYYVLLCEDNGVDTKECFALADRLESNIVSDNNFLIEYLQNKNIVMPKLDNALKNPALVLNKNVKENLEILSKYFDNYNMTGSGSCCYGVTTSYFKAKAIYKLLKKKYKKVYFAKSCK